MKVVKKRDSWISIDLQEELKNEIKQLKLQKTQYFYLQILKQFLFLDLDILSKIKQPKAEFIYILLVKICSVVVAMIFKINSTFWKVIGN